MPLANAQNDAMRTSDPLSAPTGNCPIMLDPNWPPIMQKIWARHARNGSEIFWLLFAGAVEDWRVSGH